MDKSVDMGIKDKSFTKDNFERLVVVFFIKMAKYITLLKTDSPFCVCFINFLKKFHVKENKLLHVIQFTYVSKKSNRKAGDW